MELRLWKLFRNIPSNIIFFHSQPRTSMWTLLRIELFKVFRRPRTYISFVAIAAIIFLIQLAFYSDGEAYVQFMLQSLNDSFSVDGKILNGYLICFIILQTLLVHVPLLIALVAGDMIAGEANIGTL